MKYVLNLPVLEHVTFSWLPSWFDCICGSSTTLISSIKKITKKTFEMVNINYKASLILIKKVTRNENIWLNIF